MINIFHDEHRCSWTGAVRSRPDGRAIKRSYDPLLPEHVEESGLMSYVGEAPASSVE
jgi:hypothetical protein